MFLLINNLEFLKILMEWILLIINNIGVYFNIYNRIKIYMYIKYYGLKLIGFFFNFILY